MLVFVSHSSCDEKLVAALKTLLVESGLVSAGSENGDFFVSSIDGYDVRDGKDFLDVIRDKINEMTLAISVLTPAYLDSEFCTWELGAIWARGVEWVPLRFGIKTGELPLLLKTRQAKELGKPSLDQIRNIIQKQKNIYSNEWETKRNLFLSQLPDIESTLQSEWDSTTRAIERIEARIGKASDKLLEVMERIREAESDAHKSSSAFKSSLRGVVRAIRDLLKYTTGCSIRVAIKQLAKANFTVRDLVRDKDNDMRLTAVDRVVDNTDFNEIVFGKSEYFVSNRLSQLNGYKNSHFLDVLPSYESTIVWPIRKIYEDEEDTISSDGTEETSDFLGFLCVDSKNADAFSKYDEYLVGILATALYHPVRSWTERPSGNASAK